MFLKHQKRDDIQAGLYQFLPSEGSYLKKDGCHICQALLIIFLCLIPVNAAAQLVLDGSNRQENMVAGAPNAQFVWDGDTDTSWTTGSNWQGDIVPGAANDVQINGGVNQPKISSSVSNARAIIANGVSDTGTVAVTGAGSTWINSSNLFVGYSGSGELAVSDGGSVSSADGYLGYFPDSDGMVSITGANSTWTNNIGSLNVGYIGSGKLTVSDGGSVINMGGGYIGYYADSDGTVAVTGADSVWTNNFVLRVGFYGSGELTVSEGGSVSNKFGYLGVHSTATGKVTITGADSTWTNSSNLQIGSGGTGELTVADGGVVNVNSGVGRTYVASNAGSTGTINIGAAPLDTAVAPGILNTASVEFGAGTGVINFNHSATDYQFTPDMSGAGALNHYAGFTNLSGSNNLLGITTVYGGTLSVGGNFSNTAGYVGSNSGDIGTVTVSGTGATWSNNLGLYIGVSGTGELIVSDGGVVNVNSGAGTSYVATNAGSTGTINIGAAPLDTAAAPGTLNTASVEFGAGTGAINFNHSATDYQFTPNLSGAGALNHYAGFTNLSGSINLSGTTTVSGGTLAIGPSTSTFGTMSILSGGVLDLASNNNVGDAVTVTGDYSGSGELRVDVNLANDSADKLIIGGDVTGGTTTVFADNVSGRPTGNDILLVDVAGTTTAGDFVLDGLVGAYSFNLDLIGSGWYLTNPVLSASTATYESYPQILASLNTLGSLQQRVGNRYWYGPSSAASSHGQGEAGYDGYSSSDNNAIWVHIERAHSHVEPDASTTSSQYDVDSWKMQAGTDWLLKEDGAGRLIAGINGHYSTASTDIYSTFGNGFIETSGYGVGATLTWIGNSGLYVDGQAQLSRFDSDLTSATLGTLVSGNEGSGHALSVEVGKRFESAGLIYTPRAQLIYSSVDFDSFATVSPVDGDSLKVRIGISGEHQYDWTGEDGMHNHGRIQAIANLYHEFLDGTAVNVSGVQLSSQADGWSGEVGIGGSISNAGENVMLFGEATVASSLQDFGQSYSMKGIAGIRISF